MGIKIRWYDEAHTILLHEFYNQTTREEFLASLQEIKQLAATVNYEIDIISYSPPTANPPKDVNAIGMLQDAFQKMPGNVRYLVLAGGTLFLKTLGNGVVKVLRLRDRIQFTLNIEEAEHLILKLRERQQVDSASNKPTAP
jgi:hypothetical protein